MRTLTVDDVLDGPPTWSTLIKRALRRRCPRCGGDGVFATWFRLAERCPHCGLRFMREPGFRLGAWFINWLLISVPQWCLIFGWAIWRSNHGGTLLWPILVLGGAASVVPVLTYPWSQTLWSACDLAMTPLELHEIVDAHDALGDDPAAVDGDLAGGSGAGCGSGARRISPGDPPQ